MNEIRLTRAAKAPRLSADDGADGAFLPADDILTGRGMAARPSGRAIRAGTPHIQEGPAHPIFGLATSVMAPRVMMPASVA